MSDTVRRGFGDGFDRGFGSLAFGRHAADSGAYEDEERIFHGRPHVLER